MEKNSYAIVLSDGSKIWYKDGVRHREGDLPAVEWHRQCMCEWWLNGELHRNGDAPAVVAIQMYGTLNMWYSHGLLHRADDLPAVVSWDGTLLWATNGVACRGNACKPMECRPDGSHVWEAGVAIAVCNFDEASERFAFVCTLTDCLLT